MPRSAAPSPHLRPSWPASLRLLLGEPAGGLWSDVLEAHGRQRGLRTTGVTLRPDGAATVQYAVDVSWPDGRETREVLTAATGSRIPPGTLVRECTIDGETVPVGVWRWPLDPALPALSWAASASEVAARLDSLGVASGPVRLRLRSYRPARRAVVQVTTPVGSLYLKVVPPGAVERMRARHAALDGAVPVPPVLAATDDGVLVLRGLTGTPMRTVLALGRDALPHAAAVDALLDALPPAAAAVQAPTRRRPGDALARVPEHGAVLGMVSGDLRPRLAALAAVLAEVDPGQHPAVPVHGDFYESQLLVDDGTLVGLLDVDTVGRGHRIDDWATLLGHLVLLEHVLPEPATAVTYRRELETHALGRWPPGQLRPRVAAVLLGLATGPFRVQQAEWPAETAARLALAEDWADPGTRRTDAPGA